MLRICKSLRHQAQAPSLRDAQISRNADEPSGHLLVGRRRHCPRSPNVPESAGRASSGLVPHFDEADGVSQLAKSVEADDQPNLSAEIEKELERLKWNLWHGNVHKALQIVKDLEYDLDLEEDSQEQQKLLKAVREFGTYITANSNIHSELRR